MTPANCTDAELLRLYDDVFRQHPATQELAERMEGGGRAAQLESELDDLQGECDDFERKLGAAESRIEDLEGVLEDLIERQSEENLVEAKRVLGN